VTGRHTARRSLVRRGVAAFVVGVLVATGVSAAAHWTGTATATSSITTPRVAVTAAFATPVPATLINTHTRLTNTTSFTVTNTSATAGPVTATITTPGTLAPNLPILIWSQATAACTVETPPASIVPAGTTWASATVTTASLATNASATYCVRTAVSVANRTLIATTGTGTQTATPTLTASVTQSGWTAQATATTQQRTERIYPLYTTGLTRTYGSNWYRITSSANVCLDVASSGGNNTRLISFTCHTSPNLNSNQYFQFIPVAGQAGSVTIRPAHNAALRVAVNASGQQLVQTAAAGDAQRWIVQQISATQVQLVSAVDGKCFTLLPSSGDVALTTADCTAANTTLTLTRPAVTYTQTAVVLGVLNQLLTFDLGFRLNDQTLTIYNETTAQSIPNLSTSAVEPTKVSLHLVPLVGTWINPGENILQVRLANGDVAYRFRINRSGNTVTVLEGVP